MKLFDTYPDIMTVEELAHALRIGRTMAYRLVRSGVIPCIRFGTAIRIPKAAAVGAIARKNEMAGDGYTDGGASA